MMAPILAFDGIVYWTNCSAQEEAWNDAADFECDLTPFKVWAWNLCGLVVITIWSGCITGGMFYMLNSFELLR